MLCRHPPDRLAGSDELTHDVDPEDLFHICRFDIFSKRVVISCSVADQCRWRTKRCVRGLEQTNDVCFVAGVTLYSDGPATGGLDMGNDGFSFFL